MSKLLSHQIATVSALLARSNMGMPINDAAEQAKRCAENTHTDLDSAVCALCEQYMECDEHYDMFMAEAKGFARTIKNTPTKAREMWSDVFAIAGV